MNLVRTYGPVVLSSVILALAYPPFGLGFLAFIGLIPMLSVVETENPGKVFLKFWLSGTLFHAATVLWISHVTWVGAVLAVIFLGLMYAVPFTTAAYARTCGPDLRMFALPCFVAGFEWVCSHDVLAFPWMIFGNSQASYPWIVQFADITSVFGVSWWVVAVNVIVYLAVKERNARYAAVLAALFIVPFTYSQVVIHASPQGGRSVRVAIVQGNVPQDDKWGGDVEWNIDLYRTMSLQAAERRPDLLVWPETAIPAYVLQDPYYLHMVQSFVDTLGIPVLTGLPTVELDRKKPYEERETWNSAALFMPGGVDKTQRYDKIHVVPFGEAFPFDNVFPQLRKIDLGQANWNEGKERVVFRGQGLSPFHVAICFESIFPDLNREFIRKGSSFITVITNDAWFGPRTAPYQHAMISAMRAIEFHRPVVRCANTGVSMIIDPYGRIEKKTATFERTVLFGTITPRTDMSVYAKIGNVFSTGCLVISLALIAASYINRRTFSEKTV